MPNDTPLSPDFRRLAWSNLAAQSGEQIALAAAPMVAVLALGADAGETGLLQTVLTLPYPLFAIPAGLMADRLERRHLIAMAEALRGLALAGLLCLVQFELLTWFVLALLGFVAVCGTVVFSVAAPSLVPSLVKPTALSVANARIELARTIAFAAGPVLGGMLVGWTGAATAFGAAAILSALAAALLWGIDEPARAPLPRRHPWRDVREGAAFLFRHELLRPVFVTQFVFNVAFFLVLAIFVPHAVHNLELSAVAVGATLAMYGVGLVAGALLAPRIMRALPFGTVIGVGPVSGFAASLLMALTIWLPSPVLAGLAFFVLGAGPILWLISTTTLRQLVTPPPLLGRVSAITLMSYTARPLGSGLGALLGGVSGVEICLIVAVAGFLLQALIIWLSPAVRLARQPAAVAAA